MVLETDPPFTGEVIETDGAVVSGAVVAVMVTLLLVVPPLPVQESV
jgi:hypothetical protein